MDIPRKPKVIGKAYILEKNPRLSATEVGFDPTGKSFRYDGVRYKLVGDGMFYGFEGFWKRMKKHLTALAFYEKGIPEPIKASIPEKTSDGKSGLPKLTAEDLMMIARETTTGKGLRSLKGAGKKMGGGKWLLILLLIPIIIAIVLLLPQLLGYFGVNF